MFLPDVDWIAIWKIYRPFFISAYVASSLGTRILMVRQVPAVSPAKTWLLSGAASLLIVPATPFLAIPAFVLAALIAGRAAVDSFFMAVPIAVSLGSAGALVDAVLLRLISPKAVSKKEMCFLFGTNILVTTLPISVVIALILVHPVEVIATVIW
jgi:hypothetical protein